MNMNLDFVKDKVFLKRGLIFVAALVTGCLIMINPFFTLSALSGFLVLVFAIVFPHIVVTFLIVARSSLDIFTDIGLEVGPTLLNIPSATSLFLLLGGGLYLIFNLGFRKNLVLDMVAKIYIFWLGCLFFWVALAYLNFSANGLLIALREWVRLASLLVIYLLTQELTAKIGYKKVVNFIFLALIVPMAAAIYQIIAKLGVKSGNIVRIYGTMSHPNMLALFLVLFIGLTLWKIKFRRRRFPWWVLLLVEAIALVKTFSICGMVMLAIMIAILNMKTGNTRHRMVVFALIIVVLASFALSGAGRSRLREVSRTGDIYEIVRTGSMAGRGSFAWRILNWNLLIKEWQKEPLYGYGLHMFSGSINPLRNEAHNDYLRFLIETGIIGLSLYLALLLTLGIAIWKAYHAFAVTDPQFSALAWTLFSVYIAWLIGSLTDNFITATTFQYYFWGLMGALIGHINVYARINGCLGMDGG